VPLFASGAQAAEHGLADLDAPSLEAVRAITELNRKLAALAQPEATVSTPRANNPGIPPSEPGQTRS
jgi:hypothetical protein